MMTNHLILGDSGSGKSYITCKLIDCALADYVHNDNILVDFKNVEYVKYKDNQHLYCDIINSQEKLDAILDLIENNEHMKKLNIFIDDYLCIPDRTKLNKIMSKHIKNVSLFICCQNAEALKISDIKLFDDIYFMRLSNKGIFEQMITSDFSKLKTGETIKFTLDKTYDNFEQIVRKNHENLEVIEYGIIYGNNTIVFIKAGQDGSIYGYRDKYLLLARKIREKYGYTVICSSNPFIGLNPLDNAFEVINEYCKENNFNDYKIYYMGMSNGGIVGTWFGTKYNKIKRMLLINMPLVFELRKTKQGIKRFNGEKMTLVYGSLDESYEYLDLIESFLSEKIQLVKIDGQDHYFSKETPTLYDLVEKYLLY